MIGISNYLMGCSKAKAINWAVTIHFFNKYLNVYYVPIYCCCSVAKSCLILCNPRGCSMLGSPVLHYPPEFAQIHVHESSNHLILCHLLFLLPSVFPSIRVFSNKSTLHIRWPKYWSFSFSSSPSNEYSGLISFRMDWFDILAVQGTLKSLL